MQFFWAIIYYNAWFMVVNDDPLVWFYYNWGFTAFRSSFLHGGGIEVNQGASQNLSIRSKYESLDREALLMKFAVCFTNFGPYHLARLRARPFGWQKRLAADRHRNCQYRAKVSLAPKPFR